MVPVDPMAFFFPTNVDADLLSFFLSPTTMSESSGVPVTPFFASKSDDRMDTSGLIDGLFAIPDATRRAPVQTDLQSRFGSQEQSDTSQEDHTDSNRVVSDVMGNIHSSAPPSFLPISLTLAGSPSPSSPSSKGEYEYVPEVNRYDDSPPPVTAATSWPVVMHPSLQRFEPQATTSSPPLEEESFGEPEVYEMNDKSEGEVVIVAHSPKQRKRPAAPPPSGRPAKRARLPRGTKSSAIEKIKRIPTPPPQRPIVIDDLISKPKPKPKRRSASPPKEKLDPSPKPGYPYWGAEHSANPPPVVSAPIERREIGLHTLVDPSPGERPAYNYTTLIKHAILGCPDKKMTIDGIYEQIMGRFEYYRDQNGKCDKGWKNSVRHHMSLSACFEKKERLLWESGKGVWWVVNESVEGGTKRERKRAPRTKAAREANLKLQLPRSKTVPIPITASPRPIASKVDHPLFPRALPQQLMSQKLTPKIHPSQEGLPSLPFSAFTQQQPLFNSPFVRQSLPPPPPQAALPKVPPAPSRIGNNHLSLQGLPKPTAAASSSNFQPTLRPASALPSGSTTFSQITSADSDCVGSRKNLGSAREKHGDGQSRGIIHTRWQSSTDLQFDVTPRDIRGNDTTDSEDDDDD